MSTIELWLAENDARLVEIAEQSDMLPEVVHIAAVLVVAGFTDRAIHDNLEVLNVRLHDGHDPLAGLPLALAEIREIAVTGDLP